MNSPTACRTEHIRHIILWSKWVGAIHNEAQIDVEYWMTTDKSSCLLSTSYTSGDYYELTNNNNITEYNNPWGEHIQHESSNDNRWDRSSPIEFAMLNVCGWVGLVMLVVVGWLNGGADAAGYSDRRWAIHNFIANCIGFVVLCMFVCWQSVKCPQLGTSNSRCPQRDYPSGNGPAMHFLMNAA